MSPGDLEQLTSPLTATAQLDFSTNDYLGLSRHPIVQRAAIEAIEAHGVGRRGVSAPGQASSLEDRLELAIADFESFPSALALQSGYAANINLITSIADDRSIFLYDLYAHPSLADGGRLSEAECLPFAHRDVDHLAADAPECPGTVERTAKGRHRNRRRLRCRRGDRTTAGSSEPCRAATRRSLSSTTPTPRVCSAARAPELPSTSASPRAPGSRRARCPKPLAPRVDSSRPTRR